MSLEQAYGRLIARLVASYPDVLTPMSAGILASLHMGLCKDTRTFARRLEIAHALVIRECGLLANQVGAIEIDDRRDKSGRLFYALNELGRDMLAVAEGERDAS
ncbi:MAG: hypothetical protein AAGI92_11850 [Pseudomonadota bacterium]